MSMPGGLPERENQRCSSDCCDRPAAGSLLAQPFCREHFIWQCYARLEASEEQMREPGYWENPAESVRQFIRECVEGAGRLAQEARDLSKLERARLLDILLWAARIGRRLRRSARKTISFPIRVRCERPGHPWAQDTTTRLVSRYGALVECQHHVVSGETLQVARLDRSAAAEARVAWYRRKVSGHVEMGIEFLNLDNFWEMDWSGSEPAALPAT